MDELKADPEALAEFRARDAERKRREIVELIAASPRARGVIDNFVEPPDAPVTTAVFPAISTRRPRQPGFAPRAP